MSSRSIPNTNVACISYGLWRMVRSRKARAMEKIAYFGWAASKDPRAKRLQDGVYAIGIGDEEFDSLKPEHTESWFERWRKRRTRMTTLY